jgi:hypothetical protein
MIKGEIGMAFLDVSGEVEFRYCDVEVHNTSLDSRQALRERHSSEELHDVLTHDVVGENEVRHVKSRQEKVDDKIRIDVSVCMIE